MKTQKVTLNGIKNMLSRAEMKKIMAGSGTPNCLSHGEDCNIDPQGLPCCNSCDESGRCS
jgi:hypothetical protein